MTGKENTYFGPRRSRSVLLRRELQAEIVGESLQAGRDVIGKIDSAFKRFFAAGEFKFARRVQWVFGIFSARGGVDFRDEMIHALLEIFDGHEGADVDGHERGPVAGGKVRFGEGPT